ncbi:MAG: glycosyltransferase family 2 protein [Panacagrimonas sp.]
MNATPPLVTVIIATLNRAQLVPEAIKSVQAQTMSDFEIIVVDDGSSDGTSDVVRAIGDPRIRVLRHESRRGLSAGRNTGLREARGTWVGFLDDDDRWHPDKLERQLAVSEDCVGVVCGYWLPYKRKRLVVDVGHIGLNHLRKGNPFSSSGIVARTDVAKKLGFDETLVRAEDWEFLVRLIAQGSVACVPDALYDFDDTPRPRMTGETRGQTSVEALDRFCRATVKHQQTLGPYWSSYRMARVHLGFITSAPNKRQRIAAVAGRFGWRPTLHVLFDRTVRRIG